MRRIGPKCDDCETSSTGECAACRTRAQVRADHEHDRLREEGYWTRYDMYLVEEAEARAERLGFA